MERSYKRTLTACYLGFVTQAISANFAPLLYLTFHRSYGIPLGRIAMISTVFFLTQLVVDILCARYVDRIGYRKCILASCLCSSGGLMGLLVFPELLGSPFWGILLCAVVYAVGSGLIEVLCSPIVEACPFPRKEAVMSLLHSFYCWGSVGVVIVSTVFFRVFGIERWKLLACLWALVPLLNIYNFATCPIEPPVKEGAKHVHWESASHPCFLCSWSAPEPVSLPWRSGHRHIPNLPSVFPRRQATLPDPVSLPPPWASAVCSTENSVTG